MPPEIEITPPDRPRPVLRDAMMDEPQAAGIKVDDILHVVFYHKWKIIILSMLGLIAAAVSWVTWPQQFVSEAKILIRYVVESKPILDVAEKDSDNQLKSPDSRGDSIIASEIEILTSRDLAERVAEAVGPDRILQGTTSVGVSKAAAGALIAGNLQVARRSNVLLLSFRHGDPIIAQQVLLSITTNYVQKHLETHRTMGIYEGDLENKTFELREALQRIERQIQGLKTTNLVVSFDDARKANAAHIAKATEEKFAAEVELAGLLTVVDLQARGSSTQPSSSNQMTSVNQTNKNAIATTNALVDMKTIEYGLKMEKHKDYRNRISALEMRELEMANLTDAHPDIIKVRNQLAALRQEKERLEKEYPALLMPPSSPIVSTSSSVSYNAPVASYPALDANKILALKAKTNALIQQLQFLRHEATQLDEGDRIFSTLQREKELLEASLRRYNSSLEQSRIDKKLSSGNVSNIGVVQAATPAAYLSAKKTKTVGGILAFGIFAGLAWAFLIEMVLSPTIKRPLDVRNKLKMPLFIWIPIVESMENKMHGSKSKGHDPKLIGTDSKSGKNPPSSSGSPTSDLGPGTSAISPLSSSPLPPAPWSPDHDMRHYFEALRDRLMHYFEVKNMTHKPKLVAVTSCSPQAGVSTVAAGLAALFSETGDGNVLLVDMNLDQAGGAAAHPFFRGKPGCGLADALQLDKRESAQIQENLYAATISDSDGKLSTLLPKKFSNLVPRMKASDYDYIIFDMPPVSQTSISNRLANQMDINLIVIEAETNSTAKVQDAIEMLKETHANVGAVLNRRQFHVPKQLSHEL